MNVPLLAAAAERWGTPLYVTDLDAAATNARDWADALPSALVAYAIKANPDPALLQRLVADGFGCEVVGPVELALALRAGCPPERLVVNGIGQTDADLADALATGALVNAESLGALDALVRHWSGRGRIGIRINPALDAGAHPHLATGAEDSKFGIGLDELPGALDRMREANVPLASIGAHIGSAISDPEPFGRLAELLARVARETGAAHVDLGGGFTGTPAAHAAAVGRHHPDPSRLIVEPGRSVVGGAGWLITRVVRVQRDHLIVDAGMTEFIRPMLYGAHHPVALLTPGEPSPPGTWTVSGPICEAGDILARGVELGTRAGEGALLAVGEAGAYGLAMTMNYNGRLRPAQAVMEGGKLRLSRRRETLQDLLASDA